MKKKQQIRNHPKPSAGASGHSLARDTLYTKVESHFSGLKGLNRIARGRVSGGTARNAAPGNGWRIKTVRETLLFKMGTIFRTEPGPFFILKLWDIPFRPNIGLLIGMHFRADDFVSAFPTRGDTPSSFAPGYQIPALQAAFIPVNQHCPDWVQKI